MFTFNKLVMSSGLCASLIFQATLGFAAGADMRSTAHPLLGYWESVDQKTGCQESYQFNSNGTGEFTSDKEVVKVTYEADTQPNLNGFFKLKHTVESSNGELDCTQSTSNVKALQTSYILFQPDGYSFIACDNDEAALETCFGPVVLKGAIKPQ